MIEGFIDGLMARRPALFNLYTSCQPEHGIGDDMGHHQAKLAVESRAYPLFRYDPDAGTTFEECCDLDGNPAIDDDWPTYAIKYQDDYGKEETLEVPMTFADFAVTEELTEFAFADNGKAWWIPSDRPRMDRSEMLYSQSPVSVLDSVQTPLTLESHDRRTFKVERIKSTSLTPASFQAPDDSVAREMLQAWDVISDAEPVEILIRFDPSVTQRVHETRWHPSQVEELEDDGSLIWRARVSGVLEIRSWILSWGPDAEVLEPPELREWVASRHAEAAARYSG